VSRVVLGLLILATAAGCSAVPDRAYYTPSTSPALKHASHALYRAARAAGDDPERYSFAMIASRNVVAYCTDDATFYFSEALVAQPPSVVDALIAHEVAHEVLGHAGDRRALSLSLKTGFTVLGLLVPGLGLLDFAVSPVVVRAFTRDQEIAADLRAVQILRDMGYAAPRRALAEALKAAHSVNGDAPKGLLAHEPSLDVRLSALEPLEAALTSPGPAGDSLSRR
jgi:Zn-dependent protease with chaperone function